MSATTISPQQLQALISAGTAVEMIDVRTPVEYREVHASGARNVPLDQLDAEQLIASRGDSSRPLYVICRSGSRGKQACEKFLAAGHANVVNVEGGLEACRLLQPLSLMNESILNSMKTRRYEPARRGEQKVATEITIAVRVGP